MVAAGQHRDAGPCRDGKLENTIGQLPARMTRHDDVGRLKRHCVEVSRNQRDAAGQPRPGLLQVLVQCPAGSREALINDDRLGRRVVQQQHDVGQQAMTSPEIHYTTAAKKPPGPPRNLPGLVQLLARETSGSADGSRDPVKQGLFGKTLQIVNGQPRLRRWGEHPQTVHVRRARSRLRCTGSHPEWFTVPGPAIQNYYTEVRAAPDIVAG